MLYSFSRPAVCGIPPNAHELIAEHSITPTATSALAAVVYEDAAARDGSFAFALPPNVYLPQIPNAQPDYLSAVASPVRAARPVSSIGAMPQGRIDPYLVAEVRSLGGFMPELVMRAASPDGGMLPPEGEGLGLAVVLDA